MVELPKDAGEGEPKAFSSLVHTAPSGLSIYRYITSAVVEVLSSEGAATERGVAVILSSFAPFASLSDRQRRRTAQEPRIRHS